LREERRSNFRYVRSGFDPERTSTRGKQNA
jgi:hypothetical protein